MSGGISIAGPLIQIIDNNGRFVARHTQGGKRMDRIFLNSSEAAVAARMGLNDADVTAHIGRYGRTGFVHKALFADERPTNPYGVKISPIPPTNPGLIADDEDDEETQTAIGVIFPDKTTNRTKRGKNK
jgi:hypothetical protein